jgi:hypothetical protein
MKTSPQTLTIALAGVMLASALFASAPAVRQLQSGRYRINRSAMMARRAARPEQVRARITEALTAGFIQMEPALSHSS